MSKENIQLLENESGAKNPDKPVILVFVGNYLPGYKAGGIIRNIANTIDHLSDGFDFRVITKDRDLGDTEPYGNIRFNEWQEVGNAKVYYLSPEVASLKGIKTLLTHTPHDIVLLNSFFDPLTIKTLFIRRFSGIGFKPVIVAPFGEFAWASLGQKYLKKYLFIKAAKLLGLYKNVIWRVSSEFEKNDLIKEMNIKSGTIHITGDLPIKNIPDFLSQEPTLSGSDPHDLRIVFLSRISREKNLDYALKVLSKVETNILFDIYGPAENESYWKECQSLIKQLPNNIKVNYLGNATSDQVLRIFSQYDLFLFPTGGEAYGNVIAECLTVGTPVLISTETPWRDLNNDGLGWDVDLEKMDTFVNIIQEFSSLSSAQHSEKRRVVKENIQRRLFDPFVLSSNIQLFENQLPEFKK
ncbi:Glycosyltransferase involved in cell wall bisynthesis [Pedobacter steynii]|uniref:Glycosyltransferase involved in cell wall bisynthesis n=1 Tax=Pedobacter steynii TaxID=430522 RepID=A0A1G9WJ02_9SPHI|nr:glycosyltransferase family 4 protein [Pedobacter steynii]NQX40306.1 glycosyltransferase family 4 protein [Pedobacter steynii]SDM84223.1 Glycosyltransferase involved in cell wall bisynthesis [Pedobacter steynii]